MSLKAFHLVFVAISTLLTSGFGVWAVRSYRAQGDRTLLVAGIVSFVACLSLLAYGRWFLRKLKGVSYL